VEDGAGCTCRRPARRPMDPGWRTSGPPRSDPVDRPHAHQAGGQDRSVADQRSDSTGAVACFREWRAAGTGGLLAKPFSPSGKALIHAYWRKKIASLATYVPSKVTKKEKNEMFLL
jgi:hypothetical protein